MRSDCTLRPRMIALLLPLVLAACSISESVSTSANTGLESISNSLNTFSNSISSGGGQPSAMYIRDVRAYTSVFVARGGTDQDFTRGLSRIAEQHGITHWEAVPDTMEAVGEGLAEGNASAAQVESLCASLTDGERARLVHDGYQRAQR